MVPENSSFDPQDRRFDTDVAVVGGGPGGLACAAAIQSLYDTHIRVQVRGVTTRFRPYLSVAFCCTRLHCMQVYESYPAFRPQGSGVLMGPNVQYALEAISPDLFAK